MESYIEGSTDGTFGPEDVLTRAQAVTILNRMQERSADEALFDGLEMPFNDIDDAHWAYYDIMAAAVEHRIDE